MPCSFRNCAVFASLLVLILTPSAVTAASGNPDPAYAWKPNDVLRFDYSKTIHIDETSTDADPGRRDFSFESILILEIKNRTQSGTFAVLHFDAPHVVMPDAYWYSAQADDPVDLPAQKDRTKAIVRTIEGAIKLARWNVILDNTGVVHIDSRLPKTLDEWLKETEHAAFWRGKFRKLWMEIVEKNLGLVASGDDRDLFLSLTPPPTSSRGELDKIRPYRSASELVSDKGGKAEFRFKRLAPPKAGTPYAIPYIGPPDEPKSSNVPNVLMTLKPEIRGPITDSEPKGESEQVGISVFDSKLGLLDSLSEGYSFDAEYTCDEDARRHYRIAQKVSVKYNLKRLAPPIAVRVEQAIEVPLKPK